MTQVRRISLADMVDSTGMPALGYSRPQDDEILLVDGLPKHLEKEVLAHEYDHMSRGEEGPWIGPALAAIGSITGGMLGAKGAKDAARISAQGSQAALDENSRQFDTSMLANLLLNLPTINQGNSARSMLSSLLGIKTQATDYSGLAKNFGGAGGNPGLASAFGQLSSPASNPTDPSKLMRMIEATPGFGFAKDQAMKGILGNNRALGLGKSGASVRSIGDTVGQGLAFPVYNSFLDRLAGLAGASSGSSAGLASNIGSLASNSGALNAGLVQNQADSRASGILGKYGAYGGALNDLGAIAGDYFGRPRATIQNPNYNWANR